MLDGVILVDLSALDAERVGKRPESFLSGSKPPGNVKLSISSKLKEYKLLVVRTLSLLLLLTYMLSTDVAGASKTTPLFSWP